MKRCMAAVALLVLIGCVEEPSSPSPSPPSKPVQALVETGGEEILETYRLRNNDPRNTLIVLKYGGKKHVFLLHTTMYNKDTGAMTCSESMVKVGEYDQ